MSYPGLQGYSAQYPSNNQTAPGQYNSERSSQTQPTSMTPVTGLPQPSRSQYPDPNYNWQGQNANAYSQVGGQGYGSTSWKDRSSQRQSHDYQQQQHLGYGTSSGTTTPSYYSTASQPTVGLNNLAYASGLEAAGVQSGRGYQSGASVSSTSPSVRQNGVESLKTQSRTETPAQASYSQYSRPTKSVSNVGQVGHQSQTAQYQPNSAVSRTVLKPKASSPTYRQSSPVIAAMGNRASSTNIPQINHQQVPGRVNSPTNLRQVATSNQNAHLRQSSSQSHRSPHARQASSPVTATASHTNKTASVSSPTVVPSPHAGSSSRIPTDSAGGQTYPQVPDPRGQSSSSHPSHHYQEAQQETMPGFIDPSQVYNPYHLEYERRKAAAEVEAREQTARKQAEAARLEEEKRDAHARLVKGLTRDGTIPHNPNQQQSPSTSKAPTPVQRKDAAKARKPKEQPASEGAATAATTTAAPSDSAQTEAVTSSNPDSAKAVSQDSDMAAEMKQMIEKMRTYKAKDPSLFQKLWEDLKKGSGQAGNESPQLTSTRPQYNVTQTPTQDRAVLHTPIISPTISQQGSDRHRGGMNYPFVRGIVENNPEGLPDLGRFPAQRRNRKKKQENDPTEASTNHAWHVTDSPSATGPNSHQIRALQQGTPQGGSPSIHPNSTPVSTFTASVQNPKATPPKPAPTVVTATIWPVARRQALAEAAANILNTDPTNTDHKVAIEDILALLAQNPSYIELCQRLEKQGLKFQRGRFARDLLKAVPDLNSHGPQPASTPQQNPSIGGAFPLQPTPKVPPIPRTPLPSVPNGTPSNHAAFLQGRPPINSSQSGYTVVTPMGPPPAALSSKASVPAKRTLSNSKSRPIVTPLPTPGSKAAMAKKNSFSDIVDLTALSDEEEERPKKQPRLDNLDNVSPANTAHTESQAMRAAAQGLDHALQAFNRPPVPPMYTSPYQQPPAQFHPRTYPPQYAPPYRALDDPLGDQMLNMMRAVQHEAAKPVVQSHTKDVIRPLNKAEALRKSYYNPKTIARDVLIASGRHPAERPLNSHLVKLLTNFPQIEFTSDLTTFDWDAIDPGGPPPPKVDMVDIPAGPPRYKLGEKPKGIRPRGVRVGSLNRPIGEPPLSAAQTSLARSSLTSRSSRPHISNAQPQSSLRITQSLEEGNSPDPLQNGTISTPLASTPPVVADSPDTKKMEYKPGAYYPSGKRRGRPPGAKNKHPSRSAFKAGLTTSQARVPSSGRAREASPPPAYNIFMCQWRECDGKLHNLATLRKHVRKVHIMDPDEDAYYCRWKDCRTLAKDHQTGELEPKVTFDSEEDWLDHLEKDHIEPIAFELGDGPSATVTGKKTDFSQFLYHPTSARTEIHTDDQSILKTKESFIDSRGRMVTPTMKLKGPHDPHILPADAIPVRAYNKAHGNTSDQQKAKEVLRAIEAKKAKIPGLDRGGCTLINEARRTTFLEVEDPPRIVNEDD